MNQTIIPGTFHELDSSQIGGIKSAIALGLEIQELFPRIAEDYRNGESISKITKKYHILEEFPFISEKTAQESVRYALKGASGEIEFYSAFYDGLLNSEDYDKLAREHHEESGERLGLRHGHNSGMKTLEEKTGVHALGYLDKHDAGQKGAAKQNKIPWSNEEIKKMFELRSRYMPYKIIADELNTLFHNKNSIRDENSSKKAFHRYKTRKELLDD
ncbi:MAG: hypothetical protein Q8N63_07735 [Nanoarchaeota archaeon]|nr:hypothetical protein [Nanoarchaeota archaeon]